MKLLERPRIDGKSLEREMGFEPTTAALEGRGSSAELLPLVTAGGTTGPIIIAMKGPTVDVP